MDGRAARSARKKNDGKLDRLGSTLIRKGFFKSNG